MGQSEPWSEPGACGVHAPAGGINLHPVDELADVNAQLAFLQTRKDELRAMIISGACGTIGDTHMAVVKETVSVRVDTKGLRKAWGDTVLASWLRPATSYRVVTQPIADKDNQ